MNILNILAWTEYSQSDFSTGNVRLFIMLLGKIFLLHQISSAQSSRCPSSMGGGCWQGLECYIVCVAAGLEVMNILGSNPWIPGSWVLTFSSNEQKVENC